jgi:hypothetical protein
MNLTNTNDNIHFDAKFYNPLLISEIASKIDDTC